MNDHDCPITLRSLLKHPLIAAVKSLDLPQGISLYLVGGALREYLAGGKIFSDLDFAVAYETADQSQPQAEIIARQLADTMGGHYVLLDAEWGIHRVVLKADETDLVPADASGGMLTLDIAEALDGNIHDDLARRDVTVNAMALSLKDKTFLDPFNGLADLHTKTIAMVSEKNLTDDPLRLLRVFRMASALGSTCIDVDTLAAVKKHKALIHQVAGERVHVEFLKLLSYENAFAILNLMLESGLLEELLPELTPCRTVPPNSHHHLPLLDHTLELVNQAELWLPKFSQQTQAELNEWLTPFVNRLGIVKLACLLHDVGKPDTWEIKPLENGEEKHTFYSHEKLSEDMTEAIGKRWKLSRELTERTKLLVRWHLYPCQFGEASPRKSVLKFLRKMGDMTPDVILLALADRDSTLGPAITKEVLEKSHRDHLYLLDQFYVEAETFKQPPLLTGRDVMAILNISGGPKLGEILRDLEEAHQLGEVMTIDEARAWVSQKFGTIC